MMEIFENLFRVSSACGIIMVFGCVIYAIHVARIGQPKLASRFAWLGVVYLLWSTLMILATRHSHIRELLFMMGLSVFSLLWCVLFYLIKQAQ
jgi:hypothetical protein